MGFSCKSNGLPINPGHEFTFPITAKESSVLHIQWSSSDKQDLGFSVRFMPVDGSEESILVASEKVASEETQLDIEGPGNCLLQWKNCYGGWFGGSVCTVTYSATLQSKREIEEEQQLLAEAEDEIHRKEVEQLAAELWEKEEELRRLRQAERDDKMKTLRDLEQESQVCLVETRRSLARQDAEISTLQAKLAAAEEARSAEVAMASALEQEVDAAREAIEALMDEQEQEQCESEPVDPSMDIMGLDTSPSPNAVLFCDPSRQNQKTGVTAFHYPGCEEPCDELCGAAFLGNFWDLGKDAFELTAPDYDGAVAFRNSEAAFQALKHWSMAEQFAPLSGAEAFKLKRRLQGQADFSYGGYGSHWAAMLATLRAKFSKGNIKVALLQTGNSFLMEHNSVEGRDSVWSDNCKGNGSSWLGLQLMLVRDELSGQDVWTNFIRTHIDLDSGAPLSDTGKAIWQHTVERACSALEAALEENGHRTV